MLAALFCQQLGGSIAVISRGVSSWGRPAPSPLIDKEALFERILNDVFSDFLRGQ